MSDQSRIPLRRTQFVGNNGDLRRRLEESEQTLEAARRGDADALVVSGPKGEQVYSLTGAEHVYRVIVETMNEAALTVAPDGTILFCNRQFCELMKTPVQETIGRNVIAFAAGPQQAPLRALLADAQTRLIRRRFALQSVDGTVVPVRLAASPLPAGVRASVCLVVSDLTQLDASVNSLRTLRERQQTLEESEARLARELDVTRRLQEASTRVMREGDVKSLYDAILDAAVAIMRSDFASIQMLEHEGDRRGALRLLAWKGFAPESARFWETVHLDSTTSCGMALRSGERFIITDTEQCDLIAGTPDLVECRRSGIRSVQSTPLVSRCGQLVGMISTHWRRPHRPAEQDLPALDVLARQAADLVERTQAEQALRDANEDLRAQAEQLQTANEMLQARQEQLEEAHAELEERERELMRQAEMLLVSQERLALAASGTRIGIYDRNILTGRMLWTDQVARLLGLRPTTATAATATISLEYHYHDWADRVHPEDLARVEAQVRRCMAEQTPYEMEYRVVWPDDSVHWIADRGVFQYNADGRCFRMLGILMDITDRKRAEDVLRVKENAIASSLSAIAMADLQGRLTYVNPAFLRLWGYENEREVLGRSVLEFWKEPQCATEIIQAIGNGGGWVGELVAVRKNGELLSVSVSASTAFDESGTPICMMASFVDITERKRAELALKESEFYLTRAQEIAHLGSWSWDIAAGCLYWSDETYRLYGLQPGESVPRHEDFLRFVHPDDRARVEQSVQESLVRGGPCRIDFRIVRQGGEERYVHCESQTILDSQGHPVKAEGSIQDITERKRTEEALRELTVTLESKVAQRTADIERERQRLYDVLESIPAMVCLLTPDHHVAFANRGFRKMFGDANGRRCYEFCYGRTEPCEFCETYEVLKTGKPHRWELTAADGRTIIEAYNFPFTDVDGSPLILEMDLDITERKHAEAKLQELNETLTQRTKQLQRLTLELSQAEDRERRRIADILHEDLQQQMAAIKFHLALLAGRIKTDPPLDSMASEIDEMLKNAIERSRSLSHELSPAVLHMNDMAEVLGWLARHMQTQHGLTVHVGVCGDATLESEATAMFLFRAAQEMLFNVVKHTGVREATIRVRRYGRWVGMGVSDGGPGFDLQALKDSPGFGLLNIQERVDSLGGRMTIRSRIGAGSTFRIVIPDEQIAATT